MPRFNVNAPDGSVIPVDAPEGATEQDAIAFAASTYKPKAPPVQSGIPTARKSYGLMEVPSEAISNVPASAKRFATGLYEAVTSPIQTAKGVLDIGAGALQKVLPEGAVNFINQFEGNPAAATRAVEAANAVGGMFKDRYGSYEGIKRTLAEDPVGAVADLSTLLTGGSMATARVAPSVSKTLQTASVATNPLSLVTKPAQAALAAKESMFPSQLSKQQELNAVRDATLRAAQQEGYVVTPGSVSPTGKNIISERIAGKTHLEQLASVQNETVTNKLARRAAGLPENAPLTSATMQDIRKVEYAKGYEPVKQIGEIKTDPAFLDDLISVESKYAGAGASFPGAVPEDVTRLIKNFTVDKFTSKDAIEVTRTLREQAKGNFRKGDDALAKAQIDISNALENQIERSLTASNSANAADILEQFRLSRQRMAVSHTIEDAIKEGGGSVIAAKLARDIQSGKYVSGDIKTIAEFANVFPRVTQTSSQIGAPGAGTVLGRSLGGAGGAAAGFSMGGPTGMGIGGAIGALAPEMVSAGMRNYLLSGKGQANMLPNYSPLASRLTSDEAARNALLMQQANQQNKNALRVELSNMASGRQ
tara:strand:- start:8 stop:1783 length:1776 start_codon:yes stop_codon:yes gene_type:complete